MKILDLDDWKQLCVEHPMKMVNIRRFSLQTKGWQAGNSDKLYMFFDSRSLFIEISMLELVKNNMTIECID